MEQKQLDDLDESFFGEEFVEDEGLPIMKAEPKLKKESASMPNYSSKEHKKEKKEERKAMKKVKMSKPVAKVAAERKAAKHEKNPKKEKLEEEVMIHPVKEVHKTVPGETSKSPVVLEKSPVRDIWNEENKESGFFKDITTWKAITGIVIILLLFSVFTQGFRFSQAAVKAPGGVISLTEAQQKALSFVNTNLLRPPFVAQAQKSVEENGLYKVTLSVAGDTIDSYITKDGKLFFPQGFLTSIPIRDQLRNSSATDTVSSPGVPAKTASATSAEAPASSSAPTATQPALAAVSTEVKEFTLQAKKWLFDPAMISVDKGDKVKITIEPVSLDFTFSLPAFNVEKAVSGSTVIEFTADKSGTFDYSCSSCEAWRGMNGKVVVR